MEKSQTRRRARLAVVATATVAVGALALSWAPSVGATARSSGGPGPASPVAQTVEERAAVDSLVGSLGIDRGQAERRVREQKTKLALAARLQRTLGASTSGAHLDERTGDLVVTVTDAAAETTVRAGGATPKRVARSGATLRRIKADLDRRGRGSGTAWGVHPPSNTVTVLAPTRGRTARTATFLAHARSHGAAVRIVATRNRIVPTVLTGGEAILVGTGRCSAGFLARNPVTGAIFVLTAGHCTALGGVWTEGDGLRIGPVAAINYPDNDFGAVYVESPASDPQGVVQVQPPTGSFIEDITVSGDAVVGQVICKSGSTTGTTCGPVQQLDFSYDGGAGVIAGLTLTGMCTRPGDSGGAVHWGGVAYGLVSGANNGGLPCTAGDVMAYQPINEVLAAYGLALM